MKLRVLLPLLLVAGIGLAGCIPAPPPPPPPPPPAGVDLVATDIAWPVPLVPGQRVPFSATVQNIGDTATPANAILDVLVTVDGIDIGWSDNITAPLAPGASRVQTVNGGPNGSDGLWTVTSGSHNVRAYVNSGSLPARPPIPESTRDNNMLTKPFSVRDTIVFTSARSGSPQIWSMQSDGSNLTQLTTGPERSSLPNVSRDGTKIVYTQDVPPTVLPRVWVMNADGTDQHAVFAPAIPDGGPAPPTVEMDRSPSWSPDGSQIVFARVAVGTATGLLIMNADGSDPHAIYPNTEADRFGTTSWSPNGTEIAFDYKVFCYPNLHIEIRRTDGSGQRFLVEPDSVCQDQVTLDQHPAWSPDGSQVAYQGKAVAGGTTGIWVISADGTNPVQLTQGGENPMTWLPHDNRIVFSRGGNIWTMKPDGSEQVNVAAIG